MLAIDDLLALTCDLTASLATEDRYRRLVEAVRRIIPGEAVALLHLEGDHLVPVAFTGLVPDLAGRRFRRSEHPRLDQVLERQPTSGPGAPVRFPADSPLPDPYDGLMLGDPHACARVHACLGCPLTVEGEVIGVLTVDSRDPTAFDRIDDHTIAACAALAAAGIRTAALIAALERTTRRQDAVLRQLVGDDQERRGTRLLGTSPAMQRLRREIELVAGSDLTVLITGETGVGKELVAGAIHAASRRNTEPLVQVNCAALPEGLSESALFGHLRGAFTGATADRAGAFEAADGATLFLDEVGELPLTLQPKLLRALQQGEVHRLGCDRPLRVDVRTIAATNRDLQAELGTGRFRPDLYHRLAVYPLRVPALRDRREDIPLLAGHILEREGVRLGRRGARLDAEARAGLLDHAWPGNVRELEHVLMRALLLAGASSTPPVIRRDHLGLGDIPPAIGTGSDPASAIPPDHGGPLRQRLDRYTATIIQATLRRTDGSWSASARDLGLTPSNLQRLARRLGLSRNG